MRGMIADTGGEWQLYKRHHTFAMIGDGFIPFGIRKADIPQCTKEPKTESRTAGTASAW